MQVTQLPYLTKAMGVPSLEELVGALGNVS